MNSKKAALWLWIIVIYTIATFIVSSVTNPPKFLVNKYHLDWYMHAVEYGILAILLMKYFSYRHFVGKEPAAIFTSLLFCASIGGLNELVQAYVPHRYPSLADELANIVGSLIFVGLYLAFRPARSAKSQFETE